MSSNVISPDQFSLQRLKREAKRRGKTNGSPHHENLDQVARDWGFQSFFHASRALQEAKTVPAVIPFADLVAAAVPFPGVLANITAVADREGVCIWALENDLKRFIFVTGELGVIEANDTFSTMFSFNDDLRVGLQARYRRQAKDERNAKILDDQGRPVYKLGARIDWPTFLLYVKAFRHYGEMSPEQLIWRPYAELLEQARDLLLSKSFKEFLPEIEKWLGEIDLRHFDLIHRVRDIDEMWIEMMDDEMRSEGLHLALQFMATGDPDLILDMAEPDMF